ncbi:MAG: hypothetical protein MUO67_07905, partial [Anaerolineales bacterium]|nr:hypothetical protein [Anaerolineales bacterium]
MYRYSRLYSLGAVVFIITLLSPRITIPHNTNQFQTDIIAPSNLIANPATSQLAGGFNQRPAHSLISTTAATFPFYDNFESGELGPNWERVTTNEGRIQVSDTYSQTGTFSLLLD